MATATTTTRKRRGRPALIPALESHPATKLFPMLPDDELQDLAADIAENGLLHPIVIYEGKILDGRNRYRACQLAKVKPETVEWDGEGDPTNFVLSLNLHRRHLSPAQRAMLATRLVPLLENGKGTRMAATQKVGELMSVSRSAVNDAKTIKSRATPEVQRIIEDGLTGLSDGMEISKSPAKEQRRAAAKVRRGKARTMTSANVNGQRIGSGQPVAPAQLRAMARQLEKYVASLVETADGLESKDIEEVSLCYCLDFNRATLTIARFIDHADEVTRQILGGRRK